MVKNFAGALAAAALLTLCTPALAQPSHCPPGHAKKGWCDAERHQARESYRHEDRFDRRRYGGRDEYRSERRRYGGGEDYRYERRVSPYEERRWRY